METVEQPTLGRVCIIGLGYIGLPTAAVLATRGVDVVGVDVNPAVVDAVNRGEVPFVEPDLAVTVAGAVNMGRLRATDAAVEADAFIIAVPTPFQDDHSADLSYIRTAVQGIAPLVRKGNVVILESTSPPGTTRLISQLLQETRPDLKLAHRTDRPDVFVAHCPERVLPGRIMIEMVTNDRVVGGISPQCAQRAAEYYGVFVQGSIHLTDAESAEMAKLVENAYRDVNIAFANELSLICEHLKLDVWEIIDLANRHPRVNILQPGPGVGGHCIAVDPWFIIAASRENSPLLQAARRVNDGKPSHVVEQVCTRADRFRNPRITCLGLAFKADVDDLRESPSVAIVRDLADRLRDVEIAIVEPFIQALPALLEQFPNVKLVEASTAIASADIVVLLVDHTRFRHISRAQLAGKVVIDTRGLWR